ncbi:TPA: hypothetical protein PDZ19_004667, partial [Escherichia coli]|nr:hypothetical protein [Escherichia coli]
CLAMDLSDWIEGATFGLDNVDPAVFIDAEVDTFDRLLDDYIVFRVSFGLCNHYLSLPFLFVFLLIQ